jgi:hypothetical protein
MLLICIPQLTFVPEGCDFAQEHFPAQFYQLIISIFKGFAGEWNQIMCYA